MSATRTRDPRRSARARAAALELGRRAAAAGGALIALLALLRHAPVWLAALSGTLTWFALGCATRLGAAALARAIECDQRRAARNEEAGS